MRDILRSTFIMMGFSIGFTALMAIAFELTRTTLAQNEQKAKLDYLEQVLPKESYDNNLLNTTIVLNLAESKKLGNDTPSSVYLAKKNGRTENIIIEATAPNGYGGKIRLLIAIHRSGIVQAVRVVAHKETAGLGDYIEYPKSNWILQFNNQSLQQPPSHWKVKKDGGTFDYVHGATVSPRAIVAAVHRTLQFTQVMHQHFFE